MDKENNMCCPLCRTSCAGRNINEATAEMNEVYRITIKYFPPKFLDPFWSKRSAVLCLDCWRHVIEFYSFQETIFQTQRNLVSLETDKDCGTQCKFSDSENCQNTLNKYKNKEKMDMGVNALDDDHFDISLSDLDDIDIQFSSEEEENSTANDKEFLDSNETNATTSTFQFKSSPNDTVQCNEEDQSIEDNTDKFLAKYKPKLECWICQKTVDNFKSLEYHFSSKHHRGQCYVFCCQQKLYKKEQLLDHIFCHHANPIFECKICKTHYNTALALKKHHDQKHGFNCFKCSEVFPNHTDLNEHYNAHCLCFVCKKVFDTTDDLFRHQKIVHSKIGLKRRKKLFGKCYKWGVDKRAAPNIALKYKCYVCDKKFFKFLHLRDHLNFHNNDNYYDCPHCSKSTQYWAQLERHIEFDHPDKYTAKHIQQLLRAEECHSMVIGNREDNF